MRFRFGLLSLSYRAYTPLNTEAPDSARTKKVPTWAS
jgi:hypothetical protein